METVVLDRSLRASPDAKRLNERATAISDDYAGPASFVPKSGPVTIN